MTTRCLIVEFADAPDDDPRSCEGCSFAFTSQDGAPLCTHPKLDAPRGPSGERSEECIAAERAWTATLVVPEGYEVDKRANEWCLIRGGFRDECLLAQDDGYIVVCCGRSAIQVAAVAALIWAIQHDQRPRHAGDKEAP